MSYDYTALVHTISTSYQQGDWVNACQAFETLSTHCPMTPLLWLQYAHAASSLVNTTTTNNKNDGDNNDDSINNTTTTTKSDILELALLEFPGSSILHLALIDELGKKVLRQQEPTAATTTTAADVSLYYESKLTEALQAVGRGSHLRDTYVHELYRRQIQYYKYYYYEAAKEEKCKAARQNCLRHCPLIDASVTTTTTTTAGGSEEEQSDLAHLLQEEQPHDYEEARKHASRLYQQYRTFEDDITIELQRQGIETPAFERSNNDNNDSSKKKNESSSCCCCCWYDRNSIAETCPYAMGLGNLDTARAFMRYAKTLINSSKKRKTSTNNRKDKDDDTHNNSNNNQYELGLAVYERAIAECPTVEALWCAYIQAIMQHDQEQEQPSATSRSTEEEEVILMSNLESVLTRSVRNCPYSLILAKRRITGALFLAEHKQSVLDPEVLLQHVQQALASKFLIPKQHQQQQQQAEEENTSLSTYSDVCLTLYGTVLWVVKQRILQLAQPQQLGEIPVEAQDLLEDLVDLYEEIDQCLKTQQQEDQQPVSSASRNDNNNNKKHLPWQEARSLLWRDGSKTTTWLIAPLQQQIAVASSSSCNDKNDDDEDNDRGEGSSEAKKNPKNIQSILNNNMALKWAEKALKLHNPPHPDLYIEYIHLLQLRANIIRPSATQGKKQKGQEIDNSNVAHWIQSLQSIFATATRSVGRPSTTPSMSIGVATTTTGVVTAAKSFFVFDNTLPLLRDYDTSLQQLCREWLDFEQTMGSEQSLQTARQAVQKKLAAAAAAVSQASEAATKTTNGSAGRITPLSKPYHTSRNLVPAKEETKQPAAKRAKLEPLSSDIAVDDKGGDEAVEDRVQDTSATNTTTAPAPAPAGTSSVGAAARPPSVVQKTTSPVHKVRVGKLDFPAHPFTVRVSNLSAEVQDMDLVDSFRRCGAIVHARIMREKHFQNASSFRGSVGSSVGMSKGWGLVQFEEREAVELALELSDVIGLHEKLLKVERSHIPAASLVPPGMHRVHEKGHGKYSKRNEKRKLEHRGGERQHDDNKNNNLEESNKQDGEKRGEASLSLKQHTPSTMDVLSFRPRGVGRGGHQKPRISIPDLKK